MKAKGNTNGMNGKKQMMVIKSPPVNLCGEGDKETMGMEETFIKLLQGFAQEKKIIYFISDIGLLLLKSNGLVM